MTTKPDYFHILSKLSKEFGTTKDQDKLLNLIVDAAVKTMNAKAAAIFLMDEVTEKNVAVAQTGLSDKYIHAGVGHAGKITPQLLKDGSIYFRDATTDPRLTNHEMKKAEGIASLLTVPVMVKGKMLGILSLYTSEIKKFTKDEIEFLSILAEQGGIAIENARLLNKLRENSQIFLKLAIGISSSLDVKTILQTLTEDTAKSLNVKAASVRLLDEDKRTLKLVASFGLSEKYLNKGPISAEKSIATALQGKPVVVHNASTDAGVQYKKEKQEEGIVSILCVPIKSKEDVIGVLRLYSERQRDFTDDEIILVSALAYQGGLAIQNACLYLAVQSDIKDLKENIWSHKCWF
ncbi:MAG: fused phosphoenolpyruvate-protein phosphotransferase PtsP/GAF domain protein [Smithella sp. PtaU1.Bin162]|nr:MAG: fused phosphoenolpyruvate-protein phosphotransferase PtsP/GAF domain protein [Smithella sp. PtaU1.Bin162]